MVNSATFLGNWTLRDGLKVQFQHQRISHFQQIILRFLQLLRRPRFWGGDRRERCENSEFICYLRGKIVEIEGKSRSLVTWWANGVRGKMTHLQKWRSFTCHRLDQSCWSGRCASCGKVQVYCIEEISCFFILLKGWKLPSCVRYCFCWQKV
jgi:hypothetical protein